MRSRICWHPHRDSKRTNGKAWNISSTSFVRGSTRRNCFLSPESFYLSQAIKVRHGMVEVRDSISFGVPIKYAYIITSEREHAPRSRLHNLLNSDRQQVGSSP